MKKLVVIAIVAASVFAASCTPSVTVEDSGSAAATNGISVSGTGEVFGTPDTLQMQFGVSVIRPTVQQAVGDAAALADGLITSLTSSGVATEDIQTANYSIYPEYDYSGNQQELLGYRVDNTVVAKIRDINAAGTVIDAATSGAGDEIRISGVSFSIEDDTELIAAARTAAWDDAYAKAQQLAELSGTTLGDAVAVSESFANVPPMPIYGAFAAEDAGGLATPIEAGQQQVAVTLQVQFATN